MDGFEIVSTFRWISRVEEGSQVGEGWGDQHCAKFKRVSTRLSPKKSLVLLGSHQIS